MWKILSRLFFGRPRKMKSTVQQMPTEVSFLDTQFFDLNYNSVSFPADVNGSRVRCLISMEALQDHFGALGPDAVEVFQMNSEFIRATAKRMILNGLVQDGILKIRSDDIA